MGESDVVDRIRAHVTGRDGPNEDPIDPRPPFLGPCRAIEHVDGLVIRAHGNIEELVAVHVSDRYGIVDHVVLEDPERRPVLPVDGVDGLTRREEHVGDSVAIHVLYRQRAGDRRRVIGPQRLSRRTIEREDLSGSGEDQIRARILIQIDRSHSPDRSFRVDGPQRVGGSFGLLGRHRERCAEQERREQGEGGDSAGERCVGKHRSLLEAGTARVSPGETQSSATSRAEGTPGVADSHPGAVGVQCGHRCFPASRGVPL